MDFDSLYRQWAPRVRQWVEAKRVSADAEDLVQEIFVIAHRRLSTFDGRRPGAWLFQITRRKVRDYWRSRWLTTVQMGDVRSDETPDWVAGPDEVFETGEKGQAVQRALNALPEKQRDALVRFEVEGVSGRGIAASQGVPLDTVWARIRTARMKVQESLAEEESGWMTRRRKGE